MASPKEFRQTLLVYYDADLINDEDFIILYDSFSSEIQSLLMIRTIALIG